MLWFLYLFFTQSSPETSQDSGPSAFLKSSNLVGQAASSKVSSSERKCLKAILDVTDTGLFHLLSFALLLPNFIFSVPIYDGRGKSFDYNCNLAQVHEMLPLFNAEVPAGSFLVVAYTMTAYKKGDVWNLSTNIQFVIVVATD